MNINADRLKSIILEEYLMEEGILDEEMSDERKKEMIDWIKGRGPRPKWATDDLGTSRKGKGVQSPMDPSVDRAADTMPFGPSDIPSDDAPERHVSGFQDRAGPDDTPSSEVHPTKATIDNIYELVSDMDPEDVQEIFQIVFEKLPGVEMMSPGDEGYPEEKPPTEYVRGAMGRPKISTFGLDEIKQLIRKVLTEGHYHDDDEMYDLSSGERPPAHSTATEEEPDKYEKLTTAYHALEDAVGQHPELQDALDSVAGLLDAMDTGDSMYRADENIDAEQ